MATKSVLLGLIVLLLSTTSFAQHNMDAGPKIGRYVGTVTFPKSSKRILVTLDFIIAQSENDYNKLQAFLKLYFGEFDSDEYTTYYFDNVQYSFSDKKLVFDHEGQDLTVNDGMVHMKMIHANLRSTLFAGDAKLMVTYQDDDLKPQKEPVVKSVKGDYKGTCEGKETVLQLITARSTESTPHLSNPFEAYAVSGTMSSIANPRPWTYNSFHSGSYNFYSGELKLFGLPKNYQCTVGDESIDCSDSCKFVKQRVNEKPNLLAPVRHQKKFTFLPDDEDLPTLPTPKDLSGVFTGYIHHQRSDLYQPIALNILAFRHTTMSMQPENIFLSAAATIYFGEFNSMESISYKFHERPFRNSMPALFFDGELDGILQITEWKANSIKGIWRSKIFGVVGEVELMRGAEPPALPNTYSKLPSISGEYIFDKRTLQLVTTPAESDDSMAHSPFYPWSLDGLTHIDGVTKKIKLDDGIYDFYSGLVSFRDEDDRLITGRVRPKGLSLFWPSISDFGSTHFTFEESSYERGDK